ncbi:nucleoside hydrolase [Peribacillus sp. FSL R5-0717]|uniref:nucleoside hydrolase n=1 Tax=Peribacillus sp. FSL R5-0717 TaxID=2975308 RepID=UPI0030FCC675
MGDDDLIHPTINPEPGHAVDVILDLVEKNPGEIEIVTIGPVTNIALAILKAPETMNKVKRIYTMGTAGFGAGNTTPVAEFNVYVDAEAYSIIMKSGIPISIIGFDICLGEQLGIEKIWNFYGKPKGRSDVCRSMLFFSSRIQPTGKRRALC